MQNMDNKLAVIDCGTNTFNLIIACKSGSSFNVLFEEKRAVKLGEGGIAAGFISNEAIARAIAVLVYSKERANEYACTAIHAIGTAALRSAKNSSEVISQIEIATGIHIDLIDGAIEAEWIHKGVLLDQFYRDRHIMIMDIGGGSTEFIISQSNTIEWKQSFALGAALLLDKFKPESKINNEQILELNQYLESLLIPLFENLNKYKPNILVGSAGSFETFASMIEYSKGVTDSSDSAMRYRFDTGELNRLHEQLVNSTLEQRLAMQGLWAPRADMIVLASVLFNYVRNNYFFNEYYMTHYSLREGILSMLFQLK
ncbi:MAG: exopolyphosphatase [Bacteroidetes bacterium]|nr:exopolyphosphatase [Bacteroidota bacterium]